MRIYDELHKDHIKVLGLLDDLLDLPDRADEEYRAELISEVRDEIVPHSRAEERILYNTMRANRAPKSLMRSSYQEHMQAETLLRTLQMKDKFNGDWRETAEALRNAMAHHINEEETEIFSVANQMFDDRDAERMGYAFLKLKDKIRGEGFMKTTAEMIANVMPPNLTGERFHRNMNRSSSHR